MFKLWKYLTVNNVICVWTYSKENLKIHTRSSSLPPSPPFSPLVSSYPCLPSHSYPSLLPSHTIRRGLLVKLDVLLRLRVLVSRLLKIKRSGLGVGLEKSIVTFLLLSKRKWWWWQQSACMTFVIGQLTVHVQLSIATRFLVENNDAGHNNSHRGHRPTDKTQPDRRVASVGRCELAIKHRRICVRWYEWRHSQQLRDIVVWVDVWFLTWFKGCTWVVSVYTIRRSHIENYNTKHKEHDSLWHDVSVERTAKRLINLYIVYKYGRTNVRRQTTII